MDVALVLVLLTALALTLLRVWRTLLALGRQVGRASELVGGATEQLAALSALASRDLPTRGRVGS